jgi:hypothetical protein
MVGDGSLHFVWQGNKLTPRRTMRALILLALLAVTPAERPPAGCAYPAEVPTFRLCPSAPWRILRPLASTATEVRAALGTPIDTRDIAAYLDPYPGDDRAKQPVLTFDGGPDWEILVYFVRSSLPVLREYPEALYDKLFSIDLVPRHRVPMGQITLPPGFEKQHIVAADAAWDVYRHPSGLAYEVYTTRTPYGGHQPGDLNRISYGPSDEARFRSAVRRPN